MEKKLLMVFIKNPVEGDVKTRLGASIGSANALVIYKKLLSHTHKEAAQVKSDRQVWYSSMIDHRDYWSSDLFDKRLQKGSDLGGRMSLAFKNAFADGYDRVVIIGSDCPDLTHEHIEQAFEELQEKSAVIGPSKDGGYYLLGMNRYISELFEGIEWSTPEVYSKTLDFIDRLSLSHASLVKLNDIDTIEDLKASNISLP